MRGDSAMRGGDVGRSESGVSRGNSTTSWTRGARGNGTVRGKMRGNGAMSGRGEPR
jgi:hypothetical protein